MRRRGQGPSHPRRGAGAPHFSAAAKPAAHDPEMAVRSPAPRTLERGMTATGIRPRRLATGESLEVTAMEPDGAVRRLIWIRHWRPQWPRTYNFRAPMRLPKGTRIAVFSGQPAEAGITGPAL
jgi:hypothetical protein